MIHEKKQKNLKFNTVANVVQPLVVVPHCFSWTFRAMFSTEIVGIFTIFEEHEHLDVLVL